MKRILIIITVLFCFKAEAQTDSTIVKNFALPARAIEYLTPFIANPSNDEYFQTFLKWRTSFRIINPSTTTSISTDTISVNTLVYLYNSALQSQEGFGIASVLKLYLQPFRNTNSNLNRQCTAIETLYFNQYVQSRLEGRRLLMGQ